MRKLFINIKEQTPSLRREDLVQLKSINCITLIAQMSLWATLKSLDNGQNFYWQFILENVKRTFKCRLLQL